MSMLKRLLAVAVIAVGFGFATSASMAQPTYDTIYDQPQQWDEYFLSGERNPHGFW